MLKIYYDRFRETCHNIFKSLIFFLPSFLSLFSSLHCFSRSIVFFSNSHVTFLFRVVVVTLFAAPFAHRSCTVRAPFLRRSRIVRASSLHHRRSVCHFVRCVVRAPLMHCSCPVRTLFTHRPRAVYLFSARCSPIVRTLFLVATLVILLALDRFSLFSSPSLHMCVGLWFCFGVSDRCFSLNVIARL